MWKAFVVVALVACGKGEDKPAEPKGTTPAPAPSEPTPAPAAPSEPQQKDLCKAFDKDAVAGVFGWDGMQKIVGTGTKRGEKISRNCGYRALGQNVDNAGFGATFTTDLAFEKKHIGFGLVYKQRDAIDGMEAWAGKTDTVVGLQVVAKGIRIATEVNDVGIGPEVEQKLIEATKKLVATLPAEPAALLRKE